MMPVQQLRQILILKEFMKVMDHIQGFFVPCTSSPAVAQHHPSDRKLLLRSAVGCLGPELYLAVSQSGHTCTALVRAPQARCLLA